MANRENIKQALPAEQTELASTGTGRDGLPGGTVPYQTLVQSLPLVLLTLDLKGVITSSNPAIQSLAGYDPAELSGRKLAALFHPDDADSATGVIRRAASGQPGNIENRFMTGKGEIRWVRFSMHPIHSQGKIIGLYGTLLDITRTRFLETELVRAQRLAAIGQLAASLAHEIASPLQGIIALLNILKKANPGDRELVQNLDLIREAFIKIRDTVKRLLKLNSPAERRKRRVNVNLLIQDSLSLVHSYLRKNRVKVCLDLVRDIPWTLASPIQMEQVMVNLITNAVEALSGLPRPMEPPRTGEAAVQKRSIFIHTERQENKVIIRVSDTGPGIQEEELQHIFTPGEKKGGAKMSAGLGIGLSVCRQIIRDHRGTISAANNPEGGAVLTVTLPAERNRDAKL